MNASGSVVERYVYTPYGAVTVELPDWSGTQSPTMYNNTILYTGQSLDSETDLTTPAPVGIARSSARLSAAIPRVTMRVTTSMNTPATTQ